MVPILQTHLAALVTIENTATADAIGETNSLRSAGWSWRLELEWCERKILLGWLELELVAGVL